MGFSATGNAQAQLQNSDYLSPAKAESNSLYQHAAFSKALEAGKIGKRKFENTKAILAFYQSRAGQAIWMDDDLDLKRSTDALLKTIEEAWT
ncbi:MAG: hypothetical protein ACLFR0_07295, partial [Alphaproteobacteria bacterium]